MPSNEKHSVSPWLNGLGDLRQMQAHSHCVATWQVEPGSFA
jgi:hypothetical protein